ncbi:MAG: elongation factor T [Parcubacteria group bacterium Gr01-1014_56]|nr:MAG: elongation factor T [Parcubacteria group bacterium Gr01-1014_56]
MAISPEVVKELRDKTGISVMECKKALEEANGDMTKALEILQKRALASVGKKADRTLGAGTVQAYTHTTGQVGALVVLSSETDFVSKNEEFVALARDIAMHAAAMRPGDVAELLAQAFIKDPARTIADLISQATQKFGERIEVAAVTVSAVR